MDSNLSDVALLIDAIAFAENKHRGQVRKDAKATPYIAHPIQVARLLAVEAGITDAVTLQAAVLHDTIEDTPTTHEELARIFGTEVADVVAEVTDDKTLLKHERKLRQREKAPFMSARAALVKVADKTCNLRDIHACPPRDWPLSRKQEYFDWARNVVDALPPPPSCVRTLFDNALALRPS